MHRSTLLELSRMELHEVAHVRRCFASELAHRVRHAVVTPLLGQLGHGREMSDDVLRKPRLPKAFAPRAGSGTSRYRIGLPSASEKTRA